jgi:Mn-dependent DtxR family transcriptional regulator
MTASSSSPFDYTDLRHYLRSQLSTRGEASRIAKLLRVQPAFISQVMSGRNRLSGDQVVQVSDHWGLKLDEKKLLLFWAERERASSVSLREYYDSEIKKVQKNHKKIGKHIGVAAPATNEQMALYYSSYIYALTHVLISIPEFQTVTALAPRLGVSVGRTRQILQDLESAKLVEKTSTGYKIANARMHLPEESPLIAHHHMNWRVQALQKIPLKGEQHLHYSSVITASKSDFEKIRALLVQTIGNIEAIFRPSPEEECFAIAFDFFRP